ncbi:MAG: hypothetical protein JO303_12295 [Caulobacteraceae bacterium]|nr:hypothetical protein [Caulobacteraceae bacterium]
MPADVDRRRKTLSPDAWRRALAGTAPVAAVLLAAFVFCLCDPQMFLDGDTNWHLAAGRWILAHAAAPHADPFSYTAFGKPWIDLEWLSEALMALAYALGGWATVMVLMGAAVAATLGVVGVELRRRLGGAASVGVLLVCLPMIARHVLARPHILALPLLAAWLAALLAARRRGTAPSLWLTLLMTLWANLHGSDLIGLALVVPFGLEAVLDAGAGRRRSTALRWGGFGLAAMAAALVTPYGPAGLAHAAAVTRMASLSAIVEWKPASFAEFSPLEFALLAGAFACLVQGVRLRWTRAAILLFTVHLSLQHLRHELILAVIAPMLLAEPLGDAAALKPVAVPDRRKPEAIVCGAALAAGLVLAALRIVTPETARDSAADPVTALANVPPDIAAQPVFNDYSFGGLLILDGVRPFMDGRNDLYGDAAMQSYVDAEQAKSPEAVARLLGRYGVTWTLLAPSSPLAALLDRTPGWVRVYGDGWAVTQVRADALAASERARLTGAATGRPASR